MYLVHILTLLLLSKVRSEELQENHLDAGDEETERIVNGKTAAKDMFPFTVALFYRDRYVCSASIISERSILTAGHCVVFNGVLQDPGDFYGVVGDVNKEAGTQVRFIDIVPHPEYDNLMNDLALLTTAEPISIQPVCLAAKKTGCLKPVTSIGWGITTRDTNVTVTPDNLQYTQLRVYPNKKCAVLYQTKKVPESIMCAGAFNTGLCTGDSGGPLVFKRKEYLLVGVASFVNQIFGCARLLGPAGFSNVAYYRDFIMKNARGKICVK